MAKFASVFETLEDMAISNALMGLDQLADYGNNVHRSLDAYYVNALDTAETFCFKPHEPEEVRLGAAKQCALIYNIFVAVAARHDIEWS